MTRPKKGNGSTRVIIDLSFPVGKGVNAGIMKNIYEGEIAEYTLPPVSDHLSDHLARLDGTAWMWKCDLARTYPLTRD